jgi:hypothetical protein
LIKLFLSLVFLLMELFFPLNPPYLPSPPLEGQGWVEGLGVGGGQGVVGGRGVVKRKVWRKRLEGDGINITNDATNWRNTERAKHRKRKDNSRRERGW